MDTVTGMPADSRIKAVVIRERQFIMQRVPAVAAMKMQARLLKVLAPVLSELTAVAPSLSRLDENDSARQAIGMQLIGLLPKVDMDEAVSIVIDLCQSCRHGSGPEQGNPIVFDNAFDDDLLPAYELATAVAEFNFGKYFRAFVGNEQAKEGDTTT